MRNSIDYNGRRYLRVMVNSTPEYITLPKINIGQCTNNAKSILELNSKFLIEYVEGYILTYENNSFQAQAHAWCRVSNIYFDPIIELFDNSYPEYRNIWKGHFPFRHLNIEEIPDTRDGIIPFTTDFADTIKDIEKLFPIVKNE